MDNEHFYLLSKIDGKALNTVEISCSRNRSVDLLTFVSVV